MAENALLVLDAMNAATARAWLKGGHKVFTEVATRLLVMAGWKKPSPPAITKADSKKNRQNLFTRLATMGAGRK